VVTCTVADFLDDPLRLIESLKIQDPSPDQINAVTRSASVAAGNIVHGEQKVQLELVTTLVVRVIVDPTAIRIEVHRAGLGRLVLGDEVAHQGAPDETIRLEVPICLKRRGVEAKLVIRSAAADAATPDPNLTALVAQAHGWLHVLAKGQIGSIRDIAKRDGIDPSDVGRILQLAFLAPDIIEAILAGREPIELTAKRLKRIGRLPLDWREQRRALGFTG
jgi:hypothetical protein